MDWEVRYQKGDMPWEKGYAAPPLMEFLTRRKVMGKVLVPGCGAGHDVRALAAQGAEVVGLDVAPSAVRLAASFPLVSRETYMLGDLFKLSRRMTHAFDWVFEHTCFCAISPSRRSDYVRSVSDVLKESGFLLAIFFLNPDHEGDEGPPYAVSIDELDALFGSWFELQEEWMPTRSYSGREGREWMRLLRKRLTPVGASCNG